MTTPPTMGLDVLGRIKNTSVPYSHAFIPLFEAVINSIHATEDRFGEAVAQHGEVTIKVERVPPEPTLPGITGRPPVPAIARITIVDNGCGFTDQNLLSFATADSTAKADRGGKGVGRFTWLVVFEHVQIDSVLETNDRRRESRSFRFVASKDGIEQFVAEPTDLRPTTSVTLDRVRSRYAEAVRMGPDAIADRLFEHCFNYFVLGRCPKVVLLDEGGDGPVTITINTRLDEVEASDPAALVVGEHTLEVLHVQRRFATGRKHEAHLCANKRVVESFSLTDHSDLSPEPFRNASGEPVVQQSFVSGAALDAAVDASRTRLDLPDGSALLERAGALDLRTLRERVGAAVDERLADVLRAERAENFKRLQTHIRSDQPEYRHLLTHRPNELERVRWTDDATKLDERLYQVQQHWEAEVRQRQRAVEERLVKDGADADTLADELARVIAEVNDQGQANLVRYVAKRRAVLQLLRRLISVTTGPAVEERVHRVVFPLRKSADEITYDEHNLWLVDDTLSFYEFISSDKPLSQVSEAPADSRRRPDVLAFKTGEPYQHVAIIEFKRPDRDDENPVQQLVDYAVLLRDGGAKNARGITMTGVAHSVRIDAYAICTLTPAMEQLMRRGPGNMQKIAEEGRWFGAVPGENLWLEVLDFQAFIRRAEQRNRAFFTKLGLS